MQVNCCEPKCIFTLITLDFLDVFSVFGGIENSGFEGACRDHPIQLSLESTALDLVIWGLVKPIKS